MGRAVRPALDQGSPGLARPARVPGIVGEVLRSPGRPLEGATRGDLEPRLGHDFGRVRVHADARAAESAAAVGALAYTVGRDVVFASGRYAPHSAAGRRVLAHELAHVVQQTRSSPVPGADLAVSPPDDAAEAEADRIAASLDSGREAQRPIAAVPTWRLQRQLGAPPKADPMDDPRMHPPGAPGSTTCGRPGWCPPGFCDPYSSESYARYRRAKMMPTLLLGIAAAVDSRVVPLWRDHLLGGSAPRNLSGTFAGDFARSSTTAAATTRLVAALRRSLTATPPAFPPGSDTVQIGLATRIGPEIAALNDPSSPDQMDFNIPGEVAGNLAGGIGTDQSACPSGARPSPFNDERGATGEAVVTRETSGALRVQPVVRYTVRDTIDLCPGNCGTALEQVATVPISQFEATGISGDVPFTVEFTVTPPAFAIAPPAPGAPIGPSTPPATPPPP